MGKGDVLKNVPFPHAPIPQNFETGAVISTVLFLYFYIRAPNHWSCTRY